MSNYFPKQPASRPIKYQVLAYAGGGSSVPSTNFASQTNQIRVESEVQGWLVIGDGTSVSATAQSGSMKIAANQVGEYFIVTNGQMAAFNSTSTSSGCVSIAEMS
jgi:hypothetical protein